MAQMEQFNFDTSATNYAEVSYDGSKFANQALAAEWIKDNHEELLPKVYTLPTEVDLKIAATKLGLMGGELEILTKEQIDYLDSWEHGTS